MSQRSMKTALSNFKNVLDVNCQGRKKNFFRGGKVTFLNFCLALMLFLSRLCPVEIAFRYTHYNYKFSGCKCRKKQKQNKKHAHLYTFYPSIFNFPLPFFIFTIFILFFSNFPIFPCLLFPTTSAKNYSAPLPPPTACSATGNFLISPHVLDQRTFWSHPTGYIMQFDTFFKLDQVYTCWLLYML